MRYRTDTQAFTLVEIMIVVAILGIIVAIAVPGFMRARIKSHAKACQEAQLKLSGAVMHWAMEENQIVLPTYDDLIGAEKYLQQTPICPTTNDPIPMPASFEALTVCPTNIPEHRVGG